ncbi:hypothetical protein H4Q26_005386 [Puccinia striiformis f. sp. tritici PST-130]|nr:hypothetical protein H4Q26_005386 [Puccinia striiformis f. sp. tritici PST-130]
MDLFKTGVAHPANSDQHTKVFRSRVMGVETLWTLDHDDAKYLLSTGFGNFGKSPFFKAGERIADVVAMEEHSQRVATWLSTQTDLGKSVDIQDIFARYTLTVGTQHLFGRCVDSLNDLLHDRIQNGPNPADFAQNFVAAQHWAIINSLLPPLLISLGFRLKDKATEDVRQVVDTLIQDASLSLASDIKSNASDTDKVEGEIASENLLDHLLTSGCSKELVRHECLNILLAARDTTASLLSSCFYEIARDSPRKTEIWRKLKEEVERLGSGIDGLLTLDQVREMKYLRAVLNESLRLHPLFGRILGMRLKMMCSPLVFSSPLVPIVDSSFESSKGILQCGTGRGGQFALTEASIMIIRIVEQFEGVDLDLSEGPVGAEAPAVVLTFRGGLKVRFKR